MRQPVFPFHHLHPFELQRYQCLQTLFVIFSEHSRRLVNFVKRVKPSNYRGTGVKRPVRLGMSLSYKHCHPRHKGKWRNQMRDSSLVAAAGIEARDASAYNAAHLYPGSEMKRFCFVIWMCLIVGLAALLGQDKAPSIVFDNPVRDFGKVMRGETIKHVFSFINKGSTTLEILGLEPSCGCQAALPSAKQIKAGQSGQIEVSVDTAGLIGAIDKSVNILTNDPRRRSVSLSIRADVQPEISVSSPSIFFENVPIGKEVTREVTITVQAERSIKILSAESTDESVIAKLEPVPDTEGKKIKLVATQKGDGKIGYRSGTIIVKTTSYLTPELSIYVIIRNFNR